MAINNRIAMKNKYLKISFVIGMLSFAFYACEDLADPIVEELEVNRVFAPTQLKAIVRDLTTIELTWDVREDASHYVVEFSEDSLEFTNIVRTVTVAPDELPLREVFDGETLYSARVKGVSAEGVAESKWSVVTVKTGIENIIFPLEDGDVDALVATLRWPANSQVTHFVINPGNIGRDITPDEKAAGEATITGLEGTTEYTVKLFKETKQRGTVTFTTLVDVGSATRVYPEDDLAAVIAAATSGDVLVLYPGEYNASTGVVNIDKAITIRGLYPFDRPLVHVQFSLQPGSGDILVADLDMDGTFTPEGGIETVLDHAFAYSASGTFGSLTVQGCSIHDYGKSLAAGSSSVVAEIPGISFDNCIITNVLTNSADFIDFRGAYLASLTLTNSTFNNCAPGRDFIRLDAAAGLTGTGKTTAVLIDHCTIYASSNTQDRILYVRFDANTLNVRNTLFAKTTAYFTNQSGSSQPVCSDNNYFEAAGFITPDYVTGAKMDISGNHTTLDPGFSDAASGNFTISNQTLIDNEVGDPRWRP
jgi:hypothetical protein